MSDPLKGGFHSAAERHPAPALFLSCVRQKFHTEYTEPLSGLCVKSLSAAEDTEKIFAAE